MTTPTVIETRRNGNPIRPVGPRIELARYTLPSGEQRILYGQRVDGVVRFLPAILSFSMGCGPTSTTTCVVLVDARRRGGRAYAVRRKRPRTEVLPPNAREAS